MDEIEKKILEKYEQLENTPSKYYTLLSNSDIKKFASNAPDDEPKAIKLKFIAPPKTTRLKSKKQPKLSSDEVQELDRHKRLSDVPLSEVVHYYKDAQFYYKWKNGEIIQRATLFFINDKDISGEDGNGEFVEVCDWQNSGELKLYLKHPTEISHWDKAQYKKLCYRNFDSIGKVYRISDTPASIHYAIKNKIDMFDLIERGYAIKL
jgi:hypothetical protein